MLWCIVGIVKKRLLRSWWHQKCVMSHRFILPNIVADFCGGSILIGALMSCFGVLKNGAFANTRAIFCVKRVGLLDRLACCQCCYLGRLT